MCPFQGREISRENKTKSPFVGLSVCLGGGGDLREGRSKKEGSLSDGKDMRTEQTTTGQLHTPPHPSSAC